MQNDCHGMLVRLVFTVLPRHSLRAAFLFGVLLIFVSLNASAQTVAIQGLYATGVDDSNILLGDNKADAHYVVTAIPPAASSNNLGVSRTVTTLHPLWTANTSSARWITTKGNPSAGAGSGGNNSNRVAGDFDYTLTFTMPAGAVLSTISIAGIGAADNTSQILVNGVVVAGQSIATYTGTNPFSLNNSNATFVSGTNTITFRVTNVINNTGILITSLSGTVAVPVPEVGTMFPIFGAVGFYGFVLWRRRTSGRSLIPSKS